MLNLDACRSLPQNHYCYHKLFLHIGKMQQKFTEVWTSAFLEKLADRQTCMHTERCTGIQTDGWVMHATNCFTFTTNAISKYWEWLL